jgi:hypothetical protein
VISLRETQEEEGVMDEDWGRFVTMIKSVRARERSELPEDWQLVRNRKLAEIIQTQGWEHDWVMDDRIRAVPRPVCCVAPPEVVKAAKTLVGVAADAEEEST